MLWPIHHVRIPGLLNTILTTVTIHLYSPKSSRPISYFSNTVNHSSLLYGFCRIEASGRCEGYSVRCYSHIVERKLEYLSRCDGKHCNESYMRARATAAGFVFLRPSRLAGGTVFCSVCSCVNSLLNTIFY